MLTTIATSLDGLAHDLPIVHRLLKEKIVPVVVSRQGIDVDCTGQPWLITEISDSPRDIRWRREHADGCGLVSVAAKIRGANEAWASADEVEYHAMPGDVISHDCEYAERRVLDVICPWEQLVSNRDDVQDVCWFRLAADAPAERWTGANNLEEVNADGDVMQCVLTWAMVGPRLVQCSLVGTVVRQAATV